MNHENMKMTEVGWIPKDWEVKTIGEVATSFAYGVGAEAVVYDGQNKYIRITDIDDESHLYSPSPITSPSFFIDKYVLKENDIVIARTGASVGKTYIYNPEDGKLIFAGFLMKMNVNNHSAKYVFYHTTKFDYYSWVETESQRTGQPGLNIEQLKSYAFPLPTSPSEQRRIASVLSDTDSLIASLSRNIEKKRLMKQGVMQQLLTGKTRLKGFYGNWVEKTIGGIGDTYNGITGKTKADFGIGNSRYITFLNVLNNPIIDTSILERVNIEWGEGQNEVRKGDLFFNTSSETPEEVGICATLKHDLKDVYLNSFCFGFRLTDDEVDNEYLAYYFRGSEGRYLMTTLAQGATRYNLSKDNFNKSVITLPPTKKEQQAIANILTTMDDEIAALEAERDKYISIKQGMMQKLLTGEIRLPICQTTE